MKKSTVLLVEDHLVVREGLRRLLDLDVALSVVGEASDGRQAVTLANSLRPAVILMDIAMPLLNGLESTRQVLKTLPETKILMLSAHNDDAYVTNAIAAGAAGFLLKQSSIHEISEAIHTVLAGGTFFSQRITQRFARTDPKRGTTQATAVPQAVKLTSREHEVLQLIAEGKANKETAAALGIGIKTVEKHREHLMAKLDIHDTAGLTRYAIAAGVIESPVQATTE